jgi:hypothetical protein
LGLAAADIETTKVQRSAICLRRSTFIEPGVHPIALSKKKKKTNCIIKSNKIKKQKMYAKNMENKKWKSLCYRTQRASGSKFQSCDFRDSHPL